MEKRVGFCLSDSTRSAIVTSLMRAVFNRCQQAIVSIKEGETLLLEGEQCDVDDEFVQAGLDIDEASLYCLGGYALHSAIEAYAAPTQSTERQRIHSNLVSLRLPIEEKTGLPSNIQHLDTQHSMTFMKKEMLGYLFKVLAEMRERSSEEYRRKHGLRTIQVMEDELLGNKTSFIFSSRESGIKEPHLIAVLPEVHKILVKKMVHTYGNELLQNSQLLRKKGELVLEVPLMLRDTLKVLVKSSK